MVSQPQGRREGGGLSDSLPWTELLSQICHCDLVPAKLNESNVHHPLLVASKVTKIIDLQIEDFLERLNKAVEKQRVSYDFLLSPKFIPTICYTIR